MNLKYPLYQLLCLLSFFLLAAKADAQQLPDKGFYHGEYLTYEVRFKWGLINGRAGVAKVSTKAFENSKQWYRELNFRTTGIFNTVYEMRDTLCTLFQEDAKPLRWEKRVNENDYYLVDEIQFAYTPKNTVIKSKRYHYDESKVDTIMSTSAQKQVLDMLSVWGFLRYNIFQRNKLKGEHSYHLYVPIGKDLVHCRLYYVGEETASTVLGRSTNCHKFLLNVADEAFSDSQNVEIWVSADQFRIPLKIKAKLKVGYAICLLSSPPHR